nr:hypothetical protein GCM10020185_65670 [Pseudomonas brassicacearum subsp. brassicacearum]
MAASGLALIANTAPVAFGALGTPIITLAKVTGLDEMELSMMVGRQLPFFSVIVPFWLIWAFAGWRKMLEIWPAILVAGVSFAIPQFLVSNYHGPMLVDVIAALISMACLTGFLKVWKPATVHTSAALSGRVDDSKIDASEDEKNRRPAPPFPVMRDRLCCGPGCHGSSLQSSCSPGAPRVSRTCSIPARRWTRRPNRPSSTPKASRCVRPTRSSRPW